MRLFVAAGPFVIIHEVGGGGWRFKSAFKTYRCVYHYFLNDRRYDFGLLRGRRIFLNLFISSSNRLRSWCRVWITILNLFFLGHVRVYGYPLFREAGFCWTLPLVWGSSRCIICNGWCSGNDTWVQSTIQPLGRHGWSHKSSFGRSLRILISRYQYFYCFGACSRGWTDRRSDRAIVKLVMLENLSLSQLTWWSWLSKNLMSSLQGRRIKLLEWLMIQLSMLMMNICCCSWSPCLRLLLTLMHRLKHHVGLLLRLMLLLLLGELRATLRHYLLVCALLRLLWYWYHRLSQRGDFLWLWVYDIASLIDKRLLTFEARFKVHIFNYLQFIDCNYN